MRDHRARKAQIRKAVSAAVNGTYFPSDGAHRTRSGEEHFFGIDQRTIQDSEGSRYLASLTACFWDPLNEIERHEVWQAIIGDHGGCDVGMPPGVRVKVGIRSYIYPDSDKWGDSSSGGEPFSYGEDYSKKAPMSSVPVTAPSTPLARRFAGTGSGLKPAFEPIVVARKPLIGTLCENAEKWGTGGLNIDRCRVGYAAKDDPRIGKGYAMNPQNEDEMSVFFPSASREHLLLHKPQGRWPANLVLSHSNLPLMRKCGIIPPDIECEIRRYFNGYTKVQELRDRVRDPRLASTAGAEVLQSEMYQRGQEGQDSAGLQAGQGNPNLSPMRRGVRDLEGMGAERAKKVLQLGLQDRISEDTNGQEEFALREASHCRDCRQDIQGEKGEIQGQGSPQMAGQASHYQRLSMCPSRESKTGNTAIGGADGNKKRIHIGTPSCDGDKIGPPPDDERESASYQRCQRRQSPRESDGPGSQDSFPKASGNSQADREVGTGELRTQGRDYSLEVLACDVPREWLNYFEFTGEDLGCRRVGTKRVRGHKGYPKGPGGKSMHYSDQESRGQEVRPNAWPGHADPDGYEQVDDWICVESCPVRLLGDSARYFKNIDPGQETRVDNSVFLWYNKEKQEVNQCYENVNIAIRNSMPEKQMSSEASGDSAGGPADTQAEENGARLTRGFMFPARMGGDIDAGVSLEAGNNTVSLKADGCGKESMAQSPKDMKSTTEMAIMPPMFLKTCNSLPQHGTITIISDCEKITGTLVELNTADASGAKNTNHLSASTREAQERMLDTVKIVAANICENGATTTESMSTPIKENMLGNERSLRFCYTAKSSRAERTCHGTVENKEPTVKPVNLCRYLERLVARPGAVILDPFCGSGSFGVAAVLEGFNWVGMDNRLEACQITKKRCEWAEGEDGQPRLFK